MEISRDFKNKILKAQKNEITEYKIYKKLANISSGNNKKILEKIASQELSHYNFWKKFTLEDVKPLHIKILFYYFVVKSFGFNFGLRLMEKGEESSQIVYSELKKLNPKIRDIIRDEEEHEQKLLDLLDKKELTYTSSIILGLNDALVELTGALAGFTFALQKTKIIAAAGLISGIAASLSMAGSEYLSTREEGNKNPLKASLYTGFAYIIAVILLIFPFFIFNSPLTSLTATLFLAMSIIFIFNFYISTAKNLSFKKRFFEMVAISLGIAVLSFFIGLLARRLLKIEI